MLTSTSAPKQPTTASSPIPPEHPRTTSPPSAPTASMSQSMTTSRPTWAGPSSTKALAPVHGFGQSRLRVADAVTPQTTTMALGGSGSKLEQSCARFWRGIGTRRRESDRKKRTDGAFSRRDDGRRKLALAVSERDGRNIRRGALLGNRRETAGDALARRLNERCALVGVAAL
jgi:hypothetical protein